MTINFVMSIHPSVHPFVCIEQFGSHWMDFHEILYLSIFLKSVKIQVLLKSDRVTVTLHEDKYTFFFVIISDSFLLRMRYVSDKFL